MASQALQVKRIQAEILQFQNDPSLQIHANPTPSSLFEWHFTLRGVTDTDFEGGYFHGRIDLPAQYPMKPPNIYFINPNGRFQINTKICLNITKFHPEHWNPSFTIKTMLMAMYAHFPIKDELSGVGSLTCSQSTIKQIAKESQNFVCKECGDIKLPFLKLEKELKLQETPIEDTQETNEEKVEKSIEQPFKEEEENNQNKQNPQNENQAQEKIKKQVSIAQIEDHGNSESNSEEGEGEKLFSQVQTAQDLEQQLQFQKLFQNRIQSEVENLYKICSNIQNINTNFEKQHKTKKQSKPPMSFDIDEPNGQQINWKLVEQLTQFHEVSQQGSQSQTIFEYMQDTICQYVELQNQIKEQVEITKPKIIVSTKNSNYSLISNTIWGIMAAVFLAMFFY